MSTLVLDIVVVPTYNSKTLAVMDASVYPTDPSTESSPTLEITVPGFAKVSLPFDMEEINVYSSSTLGITPLGSATLPIPDGIYILRYSVAPANTNYVEHSIMRVDQLQEKFDNAFLMLDLMECDRAIKTQATVNLNTIYMFIQGALAAANNCASVEAYKLYNKADTMLTNFVRNKCGCTGINYQVNFI